MLLEDGDGAAEKEGKPPPVMPDPRTLAVNAQTALAANTSAVATIIRAATHDHATSS